VRSCAALSPAAACAKKLPRTRIGSHRCNDQ